MNYHNGLPIAIINRTALLCVIGLHQIVQCTTGADTGFWEGGVWVTVKVTQHAT